MQLQLGSRSCCTCTYYKSSWPLSCVNSKAQYSVYSFSGTCDVPNKVPIGVFSPQVSLHKGFEHLSPFPLVAFPAYMQSPPTICTVPCLVHCCQYASTIIPCLAEALRRLVCLHMACHMHTFLQTLHMSTALQVSANAHQSLSGKCYILQIMLMPISYFTLCM